MNIIYIPSMHTHTGYSQTLLYLNWINRCHVYVTFYLGKSLPWILKSKIKILSALHSFSDKWNTLLFLNKIISFFNLIKITFLTYFPLLICNVVGHLKKLHDRSLTSHPIAISWIFIDMINTGYNLFRQITCSLANKIRIEWWHFLSLESAIYIWRQMSWHRIKCMWLVMGFL